jgi:predicted RecA/RadA family phage recombinase
MKNFVQDGETLTVPAPSGGAVSGQPYLIGAMFGIAATSAPQTEEFELVTEGVYDVTKAASQAWTVGAAVFWDNTNRVFTTTASGNTRVGVAVLPVGSGAGETAGRVRLNASF